MDSLSLDAGEAPDSRPAPEAQRAATPAEGAELSSWRDSARGLVGWLLVGLALRLLFLPTALHPDLLSVYDRVRLMHAGQFELSDYSFQALPILVHDLWARLTHVPLPDFSGVTWPNPSEGQIFEQAGLLLSQPQALVWLAIWKLPYLLVDLCVGIAIAWAVPRRHARFAGALWMLHPLALYASGAFAKYEPFMLLPLVLGLGSLIRGRTTRAMILVGVACAMRIYPLVLVAPLAIAAGRTTRERLEYAALAGLPLACVLGASASGSAIAWWLAAPLAVGLWFAYRAIRTTRVEWIAAGVLAIGVALALPSLFDRLQTAEYSVENIFHHAAFLNSGANQAADIGALSPFLLAYGALVLWLLHASGAVAPADRPGFAFEALLLAAACLFGLSFFHPQYVALLAALACLCLHRARGLASAHGLQVLGALLSLLAFPGGHTTVQLFLPLDPHNVASLPEPAAALPSVIADVPWPTIGRTLLALGGAWMALELVRRERRAPAQPAREPWLWIGVAAWPIALLLYIGSCLRPAVTVLRPSGEQLGAALVKGAAPLDFRIGERAPSGLLVTTSQPLPTGPRRWRVQFFAETTTDGKPDAEIVLEHEELYPGAIEGLSPGTLRIPLDRVQLDPNVRYRAVVFNEAPPAQVEQRVLALERVEAAQLLGEVGSNAAVRLREAGLSIFGAGEPTTQSWH